MDDPGIVQSRQHLKIISTPEMRIMMLAILSVCHQVRSFDAL
jgi:hypothetical protein